MLKFNTKISTQKNFYKNTKYFLPCGNTIKLKKLNEVIIFFTVLIFTILCIFYSYASKIASKTFEIFGSEILVKNFDIATYFPTFRRFPPFLVYREEAQK